MAEETIVAVYDTAAHAEAAVADLRAASVPESAISVHASASTSATTTSTAPVQEQGFWSSLFGGEPDHDTAVYDRSVAGGSSVVTVRVPDQHVERVLQILETHNPIDIDERASSYGLTQTTTTTQPLATGASASGATMGATMGATARSTADDGMIQLSEEQLAVGKRVVNRGGTRIRRFVVETPVEEQVTLRNETVTLERHPVTDGRPAADSFSEKAIEMTASSEEAVVSKTARVVEEVGLRKEVSDRVETVRDTVRREDVEVEQIPGGTSTTGSTFGTTGSTTTTNWHDDDWHDDDWHDPDRHAGPAGPEGLIEHPGASTAPGISLSGEKPCPARPIVTNRRCLVRQCSRPRPP